MSYIGDRRSTGYLAGSSSTPSKVRATGYSSSDDSTPAPKPPPTHYLHIKRDKAGEFRWHLRSRNGKIVAESGEGYKRVGGAVKGFESLVRGIASLRVHTGKYPIDIEAIITEV